MPHYATSTRGARWEPFRTLLRWGQPGAQARGGAQRRAPRRRGPQRHKGRRADSGVDCQERERRQAQATRRTIDHRFALLQGFTMRPLGPLGQKKVEVWISVEIVFEFPGFLTTFRKTSQKNPIQNAWARHAPAPEAVLFCDDRWVTLTRGRGCWRR
jgi:hypothetical protein